MITRAYSIFDRKSLVYYTPWFQPTDASAIRILTDLVNDPQSNIARHPGDYVLFFIGTYDDALGLMSPCSPLSHVVDAVALVTARPSTLFDRQQTVEAGMNGTSHAPNSSLA